MARFGQGPGKTALTEKQRELQAREERLRREMDQLQSLIQEAPRRAEEARRRERDALVERASTDSGRSDPFQHIGEEPRVDRRTRGNMRHRVSLKAERNAQRTQFVLLLLLLAVLCLIVLSRLP